jgi:hypothetical protein
MYYLKSSVDAQRVEVVGQRSVAKRSVACVKRLTKKFKKHCHSLFESTRVGSIKKFTTVFVTLSINFSIIIYS